MACLHAVVRALVFHGGRGPPSKPSSSPFIWFYLRPLVSTHMIGVHNPLPFFLLQPQLRRRRRLFSRLFIFQGKPTLSPTPLSRPQLAIAPLLFISFYTVYAFLSFPLYFLPFICFLLCFPLNTSASIYLLCWTRWIKAPPPKGVEWTLFN